MSNMVRIIDVETTGLEPAEGGICEIAKVDWIDGALVSPAHTLVNPGCPIPAQAKAIHHITEAAVATAPPPADALGRFGGVDIAAAHKADFDRSFVGPGFAKHWVCTYKVSLRVWPDFPAHSNQFLRYQLGLPDPPEFVDGKYLAPHRALYDALVTAHLFAELVKHMTVREMVAVSREPALLTTLMFGKHRGVKFAEAPTDYLDWLIRNHEDESVKFSARHALGIAA